MYPKPVRFVTSLVILLFSGQLLLAKTFGPETFHNRYRTADSDSERIYHLGKLAGYYYAIREDAIADSIVEKQIMLAEETRNRNIILKTLFENPRFSLMGTVVRPKSSVTTYATGKTLHYINRALSYARFAGREDYVALGYSNLSRHYLKEGEFDQAFRYANQAYTTALSTTNDSMKVISGLQLGATYLKLKEVVMAFKTFTNAYDLADKIHNKYLLSHVYHYYSLLYSQLGKDEEARDYIFRSIEINQRMNNSQALVDDYLAFGMTSEDIIQQEYYVRAEHAADSIQDMQAKIEAQRLFLLYLLSQGKSDNAINYLSNHAELKSILEKRGPDYLDWIYGEIYLYSDQPQIALTYYQKAEKAFDNYYNTEIKQRFFDEYARCYYMLNNVMAATKYYEKSFWLCQATSNFSYLIKYANYLKELYAKKGEYANAFKYSNIYSQYKDSISLISKEKDLALLEIDNVSKKRVRDTELAKIAEDRKHNLQYMGITATIASAFIALMFLGFFTVSTTMIRILGFFSFILFFEFLILLADHKIHHMMHGEPLKIWLVKIVLLSGLLPFHHWVEEKCVHYLVKRKPVLLKEKLSLRAILVGITKPAKRQYKRKGGTTAPPSV